MTLDDLPPGTLPAEPLVPRVDRAVPSLQKVTRAEEIRLQLAEQIDASVEAGEARRRPRVERWTVSVLHFERIEFAPEQSAAGGVLPILADTDERR